MILFQDEVSFALWGSLGYTWAPVGQQPVVKTTGKRKGYKVFGAIDFFSGQFFYQGLEQGRFNSERYQAFLRQVLAQTSQHIILIQDGARYHTSKATRTFFDAHRERITVCQLPSYSPDYNPIEFLWKNMKRRATHNRYFPEFDSLVASVNEGLTYFADQPEAIKNLMGVYTDSLAALPIAA
jgi:transposase